MPSTHHEPTPTNTEAPIPKVLNGMLDGLERYRQSQSDRHYAKRQQHRLYGTVMRRVLAATLDMIAVAFFIFPFLPPLPMPVGGGGASSLMSQAMSITILKIVSNPEFMVLFWKLQLVELAVMAVYVIGSLWLMQATPGMWVMRLWLRQHDRVKLPTRWQCVWFFVWACPSWGLASLGLITIPLRKDRRSVHELFSGTAITTGYYMAQQKKREMGERIAEAEAAEQAKANDAELVLPVEATVS